MFREQAISQSLGPDPVDEVMSVTRPAGWIQLGALTVLVAGAVIWAALADVPLKTTGKGVLLNEKGLAEITTATRGRILEMQVQPGDIVRKGDLIAVIDQSDLNSQLELRQAQLEEARAHERELAGFNVQLGQAQNASAASRTAGDDERLALLTQQEKTLSERERDLQQLASAGFVAREQLLRSQAELMSVRDQLVAVRGDLAAAAADRTVQGVQRARDLETTRSDIARLAAEVDELEHKSVLDRELRSPYAGRVTEVSSGIGEFVEAGTPLIGLAKSVWDGGHQEGDLQAVVYVPPDQGKQVKRGMDVDIAPSGVKANEYGFMVGHVLSVSDGPATSAGMMSVLKNDQLVRALSQQGAPFKVVVKLERAATPSGYRWTSSSGPPARIDAGTPAEAQIVTRRQRLLGLVIPPLARLFAR